MRNKIYVLSHGLKWKIQCDHCQIWIADTKAEAVSFARKHVGGLPPGTLAQILVQRTDGTWQTEWTYGKDPFPPRG